MTYIKKKIYAKKYLFNLTEAMKEKIENLAIKEGKSIADVIREAIREYIKREEKNKCK